MRFQRLFELGDGARLLSDGDIDADDILALLVDDGVEGDSGLAGLAVAAAGGQYLRGYIWDSFFAGVQFSFSGYFCAYGKSGLSFLHNTLSILLVRVPGAYLASKFFPQTLLPMGLASACGSLFSILVCVIAYHWLKRQQKAVLHG